jgi:putative oxidoreductase
MDTVDFALLILRLGVGLTFAAHGAQKVFGWWGGPGFENWQGAMAHIGFRPARVFASVSAGVELVGGLLLAVGFLTPLAGAALIGQSVVIIGQVHWQNGFFNTSGGIEFPLMLGVATAAIVLVGAGAWSIDAAIGIALEPAARVGLVLLGLAGGAVTLVIPRVSARRTSSSGSTASHA